MAMLCGIVPVSAAKQSDKYPWVTLLELSDLDPSARQRVEYNLQRYNNFIAADPQIFLCSDHILKAQAMSEEEYDYVRDLTLSITADCTTADEEILAVAEYIAKNICYNSEGYFKEEPYFPYEVLTQGYTICGGYANTFHAMMQILGHPCVNVATPEANHEWNMVYNGSRWMLMDITWLSNSTIRDGKLVKSDELNMQWYDFEIELTYESSHRISGLPYSIVDGVLQAFPQYTNVTSFRIPSSVTTIGERAFEYCESLTSVTIPSSVTSIGKNAFEGCSGLTQITIPDSVTDIGAYAFGSCGSLTSVDLPDSITTIPYRAFEYSGLTEVSIPSGVTSIDIGAFDKCTELKSVTIPKSVTEIGDYAFLSCNDLAEVYYEGSQADWQKISFGDGNHALTRAMIYYGTDEGSKDKASLNGTCGKNVTWTFVDGELTISGYGEMETYSHDRATYPPWEDWKDRITSVVIEPGITTVSKAFEGCENLKEIRIGEGTEIIDWCAFNYCITLKTITLPKSLTLIGWDAFSSCDRLETIYYQGSESQWNEIEELDEACIPSSTRIVFMGTDQKVEDKPAKEDPVTAPTFKDVKQSDWFYSFVSKICSAGQMTGKGDGIFDPNGNLSLAEVMVLASNLHSEQTGKEIPAADGVWYMKFYSYCRKEGILESLNIGEKDLSRSATRFEMVALLDRAAQKDKTSGTVNTVKDGFIPDLKESDTHGSVVYRWYRAGILTGDTSHNFNGPKNITRAEVSVILCQLLQLVDRAKI